VKTLHKILLILVIACVCVGGDQATKLIAKQHLSSAQPIYWMGDVVVLHYTENQGSFLGLGARLPDAVRFWVFIVFAGLMLVGMLSFVLISHELSLGGIIGAALIIGGGAGNLLDRIVHNGAVADFMNIGIGNVRTGIFNLADVAIMAGVGLLILTLPKRKEAQ
jgi:signal peptidase II